MTVSKRPGEDLPPRGQRFSQVYLERGDPLPDSKRMRRRLASLIKNRSDFEDRFSQYAEQELGIVTPWSSTRDWYFYLDQWELRDVLDLITLGYRHAVSCFSAHHRRTNFDYPDWWVSEARRILIEENVHYDVDDDGGIHFRWDPEFARVTIAAISTLQTARYANSRDALEKALAALAEAPPDGKAAIRGVFTATEGLFRLMFPKSPRLTAKELERLRPIVENAYRGDKPALSAATKMLDSFRDWIDAAHNYRHEAGKEDAVSQPPSAVAIHMVGTGAAHLRWLASLDADSTLQKPKQ